MISSVRFLGLRLSAMAAKMVISLARKANASLMWKILSAKSSFMGNARNAQRGTTLTNTGTALVFHPCAKLMTQITATANLVTRGT